MDNNKVGFLEKDEFKLTDAQEEYIRIYHEYFVLKWSWHELCEHHNCSKMKISNAIKWVIENRINVPSAYLVKGAIDSIQERLKINTMLFDAEISKKRFRDNNFILGLTREIREDERSIYKLQELIKEDNESKEALTSSQVLSLIKAASKSSTELVE